MKVVTEDDNICIFRADKGYATVVMNASEYDRKVHKLLDDKRSYTMVKKDPM